MTEIPQDFDWLKNWSTVVAFLAAVLSVFLSPFILDVPIGLYATLVALAFFAILSIWKSVPFSKIVKWLISFAIVAATLGWGYFLYKQSQPRFEITALDTLEGDHNAYELTDMLIWNQDELDEYGVAITFTLEIRPSYYGKRRFGEVVARISGDGDSLIEKPLWKDFTADSQTRQIHLTLPELLAASGLKENSKLPSNSFGADGLPIEQATLNVSVVQAARSGSPWSTEDITIRNAPWELRADLVWRDGEGQVDTYVCNHGGDGDFSVGYHLARVGGEFGSSSHPMHNGATSFGSWASPSEFIHLEKGSFLTHTTTLPDDLPAGRYLLEVYPFKKQNYAQFDSSSTSWTSPNTVGVPWWFSGLDGPMRYDRLAFVITESEFDEDPTILAERDRLREERGVDLGIPAGPVEEVTSPNGTQGRRQVFTDGEIYVHGGQTYALYDPILEHYEGLGGVEQDLLGFPISPIEPVTSSTGATGVRMEFEGSPDWPSFIYASEDTTAGTWGAIGQTHLDNGGHNGWLGFPLADARGHSSSISQMFEKGYIVWYYPYVEGERDWSRSPIAYPYLASRGMLFDVHADQIWQDTGVQATPGDQLTIIQVNGEWTYWEAGPERFDANGNVKEGPQEGSKLPSASLGSLIGRIGEDGDPFLVGRWRTFTAPAEGALYLAMNDGDYDDNAGYITVMIERDGE
jgi:hypothetical protein